MRIDGMNHFTILCSDVDRTRAFYGELLGLEDGWRPALSSDGLWLYAGQRPILHVLLRERLPEPPAGVIDHIAFTAVDIGAAIDRLESKGISFVFRRQVGSEIWQIFFDDPDGAKVELDFDPAETVPERHAHYLA